MTDLETALKGTDLNEMKSSTERLMNASQTFSQRLYEQAAAEGNAQTGGGTGSPAGPDDEVVDAEIVDEDGR